MPRANLIGPRFIKQGEPYEDSKFPGRVLSAKKFNSNTSDNYKS